MSAPAGGGDDAEDGGSRRNCHEHALHERRAYSVFAPNASAKLALPMLSLWLASTAARRREFFDDDHLHVAPVVGIVAMPDPRRRIHEAAGAPPHALIANFRPARAMLHEVDRLMYVSMKVASLPRGNLLQKKISIERAGIRRSNPICDGLAVWIQCASAELTTRCFSPPTCWLSRPPARAILLANSSNSSRDRVIQRPPSGIPSLSQQSSRPAMNDGPWWTRVQRNSEYGHH